jgi:hypothetical protein
MVISIRRGHAPKPQDGAAGVLDDYLMATRSA